MCAQAQFCSLCVLSVKELQGGDGGQRGPMVQQGVDVSHAGPVPAGHAGQHLGETAGVVLPTVQMMVPQELVIRPLQPGEKARMR